MWIFPLTVLLILSSKMSLQGSGCTHYPPPFRLTKNVNVLNPVCSWWTVTECVINTPVLYVATSVWSVSSLPNTNIITSTRRSTPSENICPSIYHFPNLRHWIFFALKVCHVFMHQVFSEGRRCWTDVFLLGLLAMELHSLSVFARLPPDVRMRNWMALLRAGLWGLLLLHILLSEAHSEYM